MRFLALFLFLFFSACTSRLGDKEPTFIESEIERRLRDEVSPANRCSNLPECERACNQIYSQPKARNICYNLSIKNVESIYKVFIYLREPVTRNLRRIKEHEWELFLSTGASALNNYILDYNISESRRILTWLAEERAMARSLFITGPRTYRQILLELFRVTEPAEKAIHRSLSHGETLYRISRDNNNDYTVFMVHQVITEDLCEISRYYSGLNLLEVREACVLRVYCHKREGRYVHAHEFRYISHVIEYDDIFDYIREEDPDLGLNLDYDTISPEVCDVVCSSIEGSCSS